MLGSPCNMRLTNGFVLLMLACVSAQFLCLPEILRSSRTNFVVFESHSLLHGKHPTIRCSAPPTVREVGYGCLASRAVASSTVLFCFCMGSSRGACFRKRNLVRRAGFQGSGLTGKWGCFKTEGDIDAYWKATGLPWLARKGLQLMDWGAGKNQNIREFSQEGDNIKMQYSFDGPGLGGLGFTETYEVGKGVQQITRMGGAKILVEPSWESDKVLRVQNMNPAKQTTGWAKTLLSGWFRKLNNCKIKNLIALTLNFDLSFSFSQFSVQEARTRRHSSRWLMAKRKKCPREMQLDERQINLVT